MPTENLHPTWQEHLLLDVDAVEDSFYAYPRAGDPSVLTGSRTKAGSGVVAAMPIENVNPTWHESLLYKDLLDQDPSPDEMAGRAKIEQRVLRALQAEEALRAQKEREAREEDEKEQEAELSRSDDDGSPVREPPR
jgi:hypothetical protein